MGTSAIFKSLVRMEAISAAPAGAKLKLTFDYDHQGRRVRKQVYAWTGSGYGTTPYWALLYAYDGWNLMAEMGTNGSAWHSYVWGPDLSGTLQGAGGIGGLLMMRDGATYATRYDGNGNITGWSNLTDGNDAAGFEYSPYGQVLSTSGYTSSIFGFSTKYTDPETGLLYFGYRYYDPGMGRWVSRDPIEEVDEMNMYGYVRIAPIDHVDPVGLRSWGRNFKVVDFQAGYVFHFVGNKLVQGNPYYDMKDQVPDDPGWSDIKDKIIGMAPPVPAITLVKLVVATQLERIQLDVGVTVQYELSKKLACRLVRVRWLR